MNSLNSNWSVSVPPDSLAIQEDLIMIAPSERPLLAEIGRSLTGRYRPRADGQCLGGGIRLSLAVGERTLPLQSPSWLLS